MKSVITCAIALTAFIAFASPAKAQGCAGEAIDLCGFVWNDADGNGAQNDDTDLVTDGDQSGINDVTVLLFVWNMNQWDPRFRHTNV